VSGACFGEICTELLRSGQRVRFQATGASMAPSVLEGDRLTIEPVDATQVRPGDILFYATARGLTAHRVVERVSDVPAAFRTRGDAAGSEDETVTAGQLLGRVTRVERDGRRVSFDVLPGARHRIRGRFLAIIGRLSGRLAAAGRVPPSDSRPQTSRNAVPAAPGERLTKVR